MKKLLVIGVLMSVMLVGCGSQKDSTVSNVVEEVVTEVPTENIEEATEVNVVETTTEEVVEETKDAIEEETSDAIEEEEETKDAVEEEKTTEDVEEETATDAIEEEEKTKAEVIEETTEVAEDIVAKKTAEEPAPAPAASSVKTIYFLESPADGWLEAMQQTASDLGITMIAEPMEGGYDVTINVEDGDALNRFYDELNTWGYAEVYPNIPDSPYTYYKYFN